MTTPQYAHVDTTKPNGFYVQFERKIVPDDDQPNPADRDEGFWPSQDKDSAGYVGECSEADFAEHMRKAQQRMRDWENDVWCYVGVRAVAKCLVVQNGTGTLFNLESPGVWSVESDAGDYLDELYREEISNLKDLIAAMHDPVYEG